LVQVDSDAVLHHPVDRCNQKSASAISVTNREGHVPRFEYLNDRELRDAAWEPLQRYSRAELEELVTELSLALDDRIVTTQGEKRLWRRVNRHAPLT
jgi:ribulose bisphosphate carboxylase small subunit